ncbi:MAG: hypothetical protein IJ008_04495 [Clostridia bacterium]|nr:hypothetical protein [Clostridia bacterium]
MEKLAIDTCVFFKLIDLNDIYEKNGQKYFDQYFKDLKIQYMAIEKEISNFWAENNELITKYFSANFNQNANFDNNFDIIGSKLNSRLALVNDKINMLQERINTGRIVYRDKNKNLQSVEMSKEAIEKSKELLKVSLEEQKILLDFNEEFKEVKNIFNGSNDRFKIIKMKYEAAYIFDQMIKGKLQLFVPSTSYDEILNHTYDPTKSPETNRIKRNFPREMIESLSKKVTLINTKDPEVQRFVQLLAEKYRTKGNYKGKEMAPDINSVGVYGDSLIMAECALAGIPFATQNEKDFIFNKGSKVKEADIAKGKSSTNEEKREHIRDVNNSFPELVSDVEPMSTAEFVSGDYHKVTRQSSLIKTTFQPANEKFKSTVNINLNETGIVL